MAASKSSSVPEWAFGLPMHKLVVEAVRREGRPLNSFDIAKILRDAGVQFSSRKSVVNGIFKARLAGELVRISSDSINFDIPKSPARVAAGYRDLAEKLTADGTPESERNLANKISRGAFTAAFLMQCLAVIGCTTVHLDPPPVAA